MENLPTMGATPIQIAGPQPRSTYEREVSMSTNDHLQRVLQDYQDQLYQLNQLIRNPSLALSAQAPAAAATQQSSGTPAGQQELLLKLYDEFVKTDEGKQLAAGLGKFARFAQSKVDKQQDKPA